MFAHVGQHDHLQWSSRAREYCHEFPFQLASEKLPRIDQAEHDRCSQAIEYLRLRIKLSCRWLFLAHDHLFLAIDSTAMHPL